MIKIAPSILSADFTRLGEDIDSVSGADYLHFDVMDGVFVPNISVGLPVLESVRKYTDMPLDVHLMITEPLRYVDAFCDAGADIVTFHVEAEGPEDIARAVKVIHSRGARAGLSLRPSTPAEWLLPFIPLLDLVLVMTVDPGFGGQVFMNEQLFKIRFLRDTIASRGLLCELEVDGGINPDSAREAVAAGADVLVAGSDIFKSPDRAARIALLRAL